MESASDQSREESPRRRASASLSGSPLGVPSVACGIDRPHNDAPRLITANAGDHALVHALLRAVQQAPSQEDFTTSLDEPSYEPADRLLVKRGNQIVAHAQVLHRGAWFHDVHLPVGGVQDLATLPEYRQVGYDRLLLCAAEQTMCDSQAIVSILRTDRPDVFRACGWFDVQAQGYTQANLGDVLAYLTARRPTRRRHPRRLRIRLWRYVELDAVRAVYRAAATSLWGAAHRSEAYWRWLVGRRAHSQLIVAIDGPDHADDLDVQTNIVGYAVTHGSHVVEFCCLPDYGRVAPRLLARACRDAIEHDYHTLSLHTAPSDPMHEVLVTAGGGWCADQRGSGGTLMAKLLDPHRWIEAMYLEIQRRSRKAGMERPCEIGFHAGHRRYRFLLTHRSSRLVDDGKATADVRCSAGTFAALLVGNENVVRACDEGRLHVADDRLRDKLRVLFPPVLFWQSQFDMLRF